MKKIFLIILAMSFVTSIFGDELDTYSQEINGIDKQLIELIAKRNDVSKQVGVYKKERGMQVYAPEREAKLKEIHTKMAEETGVSPDLVNNIFDQIIESSRNIQK